MKELINIIRMNLGDTTEPYRYSDNELLEAGTVAAYTYSKYNPIKRTDELSNGDLLPEDYQTWVNGLSDCEIVNNRLSAPHQHKIQYTYLAYRTLNEIPKSDYPLIADYCFYHIMSSQINEKSDISGIKLGQGLQIQFNNIAELEKMALSRLDKFTHSLSQTFGGWV